MDCHSDETYEIDCAVAVLLAISNRCKQCISYTVLQNWLDKHMQYPYQTQLEKEKLVETSGFTMRQIENWFANTRKRKLIPGTFQRPRKCKKP